MLRNEFVRVVSGNSGHSSSTLAAATGNNQGQQGSSTMSPNTKYNSTAPYQQHGSSSGGSGAHHPHHSHSTTAVTSGYNTHNSHTHHNHNHHNHNHGHNHHSLNRGGHGSGSGGGGGGGHAHSYSSTTLNLPPGKDLTPEELQLLAEIRQRKEELLLEIEQLQNEIDSVSKEIGRVPLAEHEDNLSIHSNDSKDTKFMSLGCKKFNMDPKKGIEFLTGHGLLEKDHESIALFLYRGEGLSKTAIGDYLGEKNEFNENVLRSFVALHDFTDLILVQALRQFLWSFRLPGEAQKIDRMMECFAQRYCILNPDIFTNTDTCYVLSFAIIMLNTSLHNPSVKEKPTVEQFITMNRGINNGEDLPKELLISLYNSIQAEPFKIPEDDGNDLMHTFFNPDKEGWLWKQGGRYKSWKRRWFILNDNCLYYFEFTTDKEPRGIIPLENVDIRTVSERKNTFEMYTAPGELIKACKTDSGGRVVEGKHAVYRMSAGSEEERDAWVQALKSSISRSPFYELLANRKKAAQQLHNMIRK